MTPYHSSIGASLSQLSLLVHFSPSHRFVQRLQRRPVKTSRLHGRSCRRLRCRCRSRRRCPASPPAGGTTVGGGRVSPQAATSTTTTQHTANRHAIGLRITPVNVRTQGNPHGASIIHVSNLLAYRSIACATADQDCDKSEELGPTKRARKAKNPAKGASTSVPQIYPITLDPKSSSRNY